MNYLKPDDIFYDIGANIRLIVYPFALPYFGSGILKNLKNINSALEECNVKAKIYHVDVNRNSRDTNYKPCLLLPLINIFQWKNLKVFAELYGIMINSK